MAERKIYRVDDFPPSKLERDPVTGIYLDIPARVRELYAQNCFMMDFFNVSIDEIHCGSCQVSLKIDHDRHANNRNVVHGGVLAALADSVLGVTACAVGEKVVTVSFAMNYIRNIDFYGTARVVSQIVSHQEKTMLISARMYDDEDRLMATISCNMMIVGKYEGIPAKW